MKHQTQLLTWLCMILLVCVGLPHAWGAAFIQCPGDASEPRDAVPDPFLDPPANLIPNPDFDPNVKCMSLTGGDGFITMADGRVQYIFGFSDVTGLPEDQLLDIGVFRANFPAPTIVQKQGQEFYLTLTNVGTFNRPDLFDPHSVHYHGFPQSSAIFDGLPESAIAINQGASITYYYKVQQPGTYMYHCHVEATEHMQMGMLGNLYVEPAQNGQSIGGFTKFVYNDGDGSTGYDVEYPIQIGSFDPAFHDASLNTQPLPFANMKDTYPMLNGRGYPQATDPNPLPSPVESSAASAQPISSLIQATAGQKILLRISNLNVTNFYTLTAQGLPMRVVGRGARILRGGGTPEGVPLYYNTTTVTLGGGESVDVILDTTGVPPGTYFLHTTNLNFLSNDKEDFGGMMTEIVIN